MPHPPQATSLDISVNGDTRQVEPGCTVAGLLEQLELAGKRVAVARNTEVVPRSAYARACLSAGDEIEILEAVGGG